VLCEARADETTGYYSFSGLADGEYYLAAGGIGIDPWWYPGVPSIESADVVLVKDHGSVTGIDWSLPE
jgi:hypothetical protein